MKKTLASIVLTVALFIAVTVNALATITSTADIDIKLNQLNKLVNFNIRGLVNKTELIGERQQNFDMLTDQYKNDTVLSLESVKDILNQIDLIRNSKDISAGEKNIQISKLYQEVDTILYNIDSKTIKYMYSLRLIMPTVTYQRFSKKFRNFYNDLSLTNNQLTSK